MIELVKESKLIYYKDFDSKEAQEYHNSLLNQDWLIKGERLINDGGYEVEYTKWYK